MKMGTTGLPRPVGPYSHARRAGDLVFCAGSMPLDKETSRPLAELDVRDQTRAVLDNLRAVLEAAESSLGDVVRTTVYLADLDDYAEMNAVYREYFEDPAPARATVEVSRLIGGIAVEIDAVATVSSNAAGKEKESR